MKKILWSGFCILFIVSVSLALGDNLSSSTTSVSMQNGEYYVGPEDVLSVTVWQHSEMSMTATVGPDGNITYPLVGTIKVRGLTRDQVRDTLAKAIAKYFVDPKVNVDIASYNSARVKVLGLVTTPGVYQLKGQNTLVSVIAQAGGPSSSAQLRQVTILRGPDKILEVDLYKILYEGKIALDVPLMPDDTVFVPDNRKTRVFVLGQVNTPGILDIGDHLTVLEAISKSGGYKDGAKFYDVYIVRGGTDKEKPKVIHVDLNKQMLKGIAPKEQELQPNDIVYVPRGYVTELNYVLNALSPALKTIILGDSAYTAIKGTSGASVTIQQ